MKGAGPAALHVYYGSGKGKTTAALGQALRAWGAGWRVLVAQLLKEERARSGEVAAARRLGARFRLLREELPAPVLRDPGPAGRRALRAAAARLLERAVAEARTRRAGLVVLDEALVAVHLRLVSLAALRRAVAELSRCGVRLVVLTGRWAPAGILGEADLVTEVREVRHPYARGVAAVHGIDF